MTEGFPEDELPTGWVLWADDPGGRTVLVYRPDVFDSDRFPAPCLPTIFVSDGSRRGRPGRSPDGWHATLFLEPEVELATRSVPDRDTALEAAIELAGRFSEGDLDYRGAYQVPRDLYLDELDRLLGRRSE